MGVAGEHHDHGRPVLAVFLGRVWNIHNGLAGVHHAISIIVVKGGNTGIQGTGNCAAAGVGKPGGLQRSELNGFLLPVHSFKGVGREDLSIFSRLPGRLCCLIIVGAYTQRIAVCKRIGIAGVAIQEVMNLRSGQGGFLRHLDLRDPVLCAPAFGNVVGVSSLPGVRVERLAVNAFLTGRHSVVDGLPISHTFVLLAVSGQECGNGNI